MPVAELEEATAVTVTVPDAPEMHFAKPLWLIVAIFRLEIAQLPEYGSTNGTGAGEGGLLNVPVAVNCIWPICAVAFDGVIAMDWSTRFEFMAPQPTA